MVKTVSAEAVGAWTDALATEVPGREAIDIHSSGITKRAKTLPLKPVPRSLAGVISGFLSAGYGRLSGVTLPALTGLTRESPWFATAFELTRLPRAKTCSACAGIGVAIPMRTARTATTQ